MTGTGFIAGAWPFSMLKEFLQEASTGCHELLLTLGSGFWAGV